MAKKIKVSVEVKKQLIEEFGGMNDQTFYNALNYITGTPSAKLLRKRALELGGVEWFTRDEVIDGAAAENV